MKRLRKLIALLLILTSGLTLSAPDRTAADTLWPEGPSVNAVSAILMEADTGAILYEKNIHEQHYPASITKIMTTLLALENCSLQEVVTFSYDSVHKIEGTHIGMKENEQITLEQCLYAIMLGSANEVSYAVAEHVGGSFDNFVAMMNEKAAALGCTETHFSNPHGLPDETHLTSAHDMALIAQAAYANDMFCTITRTCSYTIPATNLTAETRPISNHHKMLKKGEFKYEGCTGGKTGYTNIARNTLVTFAERNGLSLICVIMKDDVSKDQYVDTAALLDYGFNNFQKLSVSESDLGLQLSSEGFFPVENNPLAVDTGEISLATSAQLVLPNQATLDNLTHSISFTGNSEGEIAIVNCSLGEHFLGNVSINFTPGEASIAQADATQKTTKKTVPSFPVKKVLLIIFISLCILGFIGVILYCIRNGVFEIDYSVTSRKSRLPKKKKSSRKSRYTVRLGKKAPRNVSQKSYGSPKTPRLESEFESSMQDSEFDRFDRND